MILSFGTLCQVLECPQLLGATKNKSGSLDNHQILKGNQELRPDKTGEVIAYTRSVCQMREVSVLYRAQKPTQKTQENEEMGKCSEQKNKINVHKSIVMKWR